MNFFGFVRRTRLSHVFVGIAVFAIMLNANINYATASVGTYRIDNHLESLIHAAELEYTNFIKDTLTNLDDVKAILDLADTAVDIKDMVNDFELQSELESLISDQINGLSNSLTSESLSSILSGGLNANNVSDEAEKVVKEGAENVANSLVTGEAVTAAANAYDTVKEYIETTADLPKTKKNSTGASAPEATKPVDEQSDSEMSENAIKSATILVKEIAPLSFAGAQTTAAQLSAGTSSETQQEYALELADKSRSGAIKEIVKILAPYTTDKDSKLSYRYPINKIREQSEKAMERASEHSKGGPSQALKTIAGLSAVLVEQQNLQNELIITLADILADDIKMNGINAVLSVEGYAVGIQDNVTKFQEIYDRASIIR